MQRSADQSSTTQLHRGSTFVVVLALLALLSIIGLAFVTFTGAEKESAEYFVATSNRKVAPQIDTDGTIEFGIEQLVLGAHQYQYNSALWGGRHSLLAGMFGNDLNPHNGEGIHLALDRNNNNQVIVDQDFNGIQDTTTIPGMLLRINDSPVVHGGRLPATAWLFQFPAPDTGYTYPDINNVFLSWQGMALDHETDGPTQTPVLPVPVNVILPSFHRPQLLREITNIPWPNWEVHPNAGGRVLRPHRSHWHVLENGTPSASRRFVSATDVFNGEPLTDWAGLSGPFPWGTEDLNRNGTLDAREDVNGNGVLDNEAHYGVWTLSGTPATRPGQWQRNQQTNGPDYYQRVEDNNGNFGPVHHTLGQQLPTFAPTYSFDADADGDGTKEAVWLDLDHPVRVLADGRMVIPLFAFTVRDADGLVNVNTAGNAVNIGTDQRTGQLPNISSTSLSQNEDVDENGVLNTNEDTFVANTLLDLGFVSRSNLGMTPSEVNPQWVLNAHPLFDKPPHRTYRELFEQHAKTFTTLQNFQPASRIHTSNIEWWLALYGTFDSRSGLYYHGREGNLAQPNNRTGGAGIFNVDDNFNQPEGMPALGQSQSFVHPLDFRGTGRSIVKAEDSQDPLDQSLKWRVLMNTNNYQRNSNYEGYQGAPRWDPTPGPYKPDTNWFQDDSTETILDHRYRQNSDTIFSAKENYFLQASNSDIELSPAESRLAKLMPYNLRDNVRAEQIRRNLTTDSWDLKLPSRRINQRRKGEFPAGRVPPSLLQNNVLRPEVYQLLSQTAELLSGQTTNPADKPTLPVRFQQHFQNYNPDTDYYTRQYRLSINHLLEFEQTDLDGNGVRDLVMRPLTPYPQPTDTDKDAKRDRANRDRQKLARDIFSLLYLYGGGRDDLFDKYGVIQSNALTWSMAGGVSQPRQFHTINRLREMAQFAANLVDSLDRDDVITKFEYPKDLSGGWGLDDNAFTEEGGQNAYLNSNHPEYTREYPNDSAGRGVVFGVERQKLTLSEFHAVRTMQVKKDGNPVDHHATAYDDKQPHVFAYAEVENASTFPVALGKGHWRIVFQENDGKAGVNDVAAKARILTLWGTDRTWNQVPIGSKRAIAVRGDRIDLDIQYPDNGTPNENKFRSALAMDFNYMDATMDAPAGHNYRVIVPFLINNNWTGYNTMKSGADPILIDLIEPNPNPLRRFRVTNPANTPYKDEEERLLELPSCFTNVAGTDSTINICIVLQRRLDLTREDVPDPYISTPSVLETYDRQQNPWVEVDRMVYTRTADQWQFEIGEPTQMVDPNILVELKDLQSKQRPEPLKHGFEALHAQVEQANTLGIANTNDQPQRVVQRHLDRDFASVGELLTLPLYNPREVPRLLQYAGKRPRDQYQRSMALNPRPASRSFIAANRFLRPDHPSRQFPSDNNGNGYPPSSLANNSADLPITKWDNRWSRLLEFVEVPSRNERFANTSPDASARPNYLPAKRRHRVAGKINLNTVRDPDVLAALLDEQHAVQRNRSPLWAGHFLVDQYARHRRPEATGGTPDWWDPQFRASLTRDWWRQFMLSRDNLDPATGLFLPGVPGSRPFRSPGFVAAGSTSIQHTVLRSRPHYGPLSGDTNGNGLLDSAENSVDQSGQVIFFQGGTDRKRLFELGVGEDLNGNGVLDSREDVNNNGVLDSGEDLNNNGVLDLDDENLDGNNQLDQLEIDPVARHHLLSKVMNNSTVRSHVFHVFLKVEWFEAYRGPSPTNPSQKITLIGAKATDVPSRRAFFVIDRSRAIEQATTIQVLPPFSLTEDANGNGVLDPGEDLNNNNVLDTKRGFNFADAPRPIDISPLILHQRIIE